MATFKTPKPNPVRLAPAYTNPHTPSEHIAHQFANKMRPDPNGNNLHDYYEVDREKQVIGQDESSEL